MKFNTETIKAVVSALIVVLVDVLAAFGITADAGTVANALYVIILVVVTGYGCWKNHNFTEAAQQAQKTLDELKG